MHASEIYWTVAVKYEIKGKTFKGLNKRLRMFIGRYEGYATESKMRDWAKINLPKSLMENCSIREQFDFSM